MRDAIGLRYIRCCTAGALLLAGLLAPCQAGAAGFAAAVSPPRFELTARPGELLRNVIELTNASPEPMEYQLHTADWTMSHDFQVQFQDALQPGSCRPWVRLERPTAAVPRSATLRYRFEVQVPADAAAGECRFAIMIEGKDPALAQAGAVELPVAGRIGVIVYVTIGDAAPDLEVFGPTVVNSNGRDVPAVRVHNRGNAHGRLGGFLTGTDAHGKHYDLIAADFPILPQEEVYINLTPSDGTDAVPVVDYPLHVQGTLEWAGQRHDFDEQFR